MASETETLTLDPAHNVASIRRRLSAIRGKRVLLVLPDAGDLLRRKLDLILVQREAHRRAIQLAIVSRDPGVREGARELNISCFESVAESETTRWKRGRQRVFLPRYHKPGDSPKPDALRAVASRLDDRPRPRPLLYLQRFVILALLLGVVGAALAIILPGAEVVISLRPERISVTAAIIADVNVENVNIDQGSMPAQRLHAAAETRASAPTSGRRRIDSALATGQATFSNRGETEVSLPADTILSTSAGEPVLFRTLEAIVVPAGQDESATARIEALQRFAGSAGNVAAGMINTVLGPNAENLSVINLSAAAGGGPQFVKVVTERDQSTLLSSARAQLLAIAYEQMRSQLSDSQVIVIESLAITRERKDWTVYSADVGEPASELSLDLRADLSALIVDERHSRQITRARLSASVPPGQALQAESLRFARGPISWKAGSDRAEFTAGLSGMMTQKVDSGNLRERLAGLPIEDARRMLEAQFGAAGAAAITVSPSAWKRMPMLPIRIHLELRRPA